MRSTVVYGPAYLDRVIRVDGPLSPHGRIDGSMDGQIDTPAADAVLVDRCGARILLRSDHLAVRPLGTVNVDGLFGIEPPHEVTLEVVADTDELGGMGAGYAKALGGCLISALGGHADPIAIRVSAMLNAEGIFHRPIRVPACASDWSLIVSSGRFGDKLAIGFRGCHAAVAQLDVSTEPECDLLVVAALPNRLISQALLHRARARFLAPAMRNAKDLEVPLASLSGRFDIVCLNRAEWTAIGDRESIVNHTPIVVVTDGPAGASITFLSDTGSRETLIVPAFHRMRPPRDTNRAGEAFASTLVATLLKSGWVPGPCDPRALTLAAHRASAAAALVIDREDFGFPTADQIDAAIARGVVE